MASRDRQVRKAATAFAVAAFLTLIFTLAAATAAQAASGDVLWTRAYQPKGYSLISNEHLARGPGGDIWIAGSGEHGVGDAEYVVARIRSSGARRWVLALDTGLHQDQYLSDVAVDRFGNAVVTGYISRKVGMNLWYTAKIGPTGKVRWRRKLTPAGDKMLVTANGVAVDRGGNVYVAGSIVRSGHSGDAALVKYSPRGTLLWRRYINGTANTRDEATDVVVDASGRVFVAASVSYSDSSSDIVAARYTRGGRRVWVSRWNGPSATSSDHATALAVSKAGIAVGGIAAQFSPLERGATVVWGLDGATKWGDPLTSIGNVWNLAVAINGSGAVAAAGKVFAPTIQSHFTRYTSTGAFDFWRNETGSANDGGCNAVRITSGGVVFAVGYLWETDGLSTYVAGCDGGAYDWFIAWRGSSSLRCTGEDLIVSSQSLYVAGTIGGRMSLQKVAR